MTVLQSRVNWVLQQAHIRLGNPYVYGGVYSPYDTGQGADCSGVVGWVLEALTKGPEAMSWGHNVSTESWYYDYGSDTPSTPGTVGPYGTVAVASLGDIPADAALTVNLMHGGGGEDSHTNCVVPLPGSAPWDGVLVESNGSYGSCTNGSGAYPSTASLWTDHWYLPGPWVMDVEPVTPGSAPADNPVASGSYIVRPGDSMSSIAALHGVSLRALELANPSITNPSLIYAGQVLVIP